MMLDQKVLTLLDELICSERYRREQEIKNQIERVRNRAGMSAGMSRSGTVIEHEALVYEEQLKAWGWMIWNSLARIIGHLDSIGSSDLAADIKTVVESNVVPFANEFNTCLSKRQSQIGIHMNRTIDEARDALFKRLNVEIELFVARLSRQPQQPPSTTQIFKGPVGAVQFGAGASATVIQTMDIEVKQSLQAALNSVRQAIKNDPVLPPRQNEELLNKVEEAHQELERPDPNSKRLIDLLGPVAATIQTIAALRPFYEEIKIALNFWGVYLP